jgi:hypothetical protein
MDKLPVEQNTVPDEDVIPPFPKRAQHPQAWWEGTGMALTYRLNRTGEINPHCVTPARMSRREDGAAWKGASNVRPRRQDRMVFPKYEGTLKAISF